MLPVKKIYVDSKYKTTDSVSDSNFKFQLPQTCYMPDDTKFFISDVCIPHTWNTINDFNSKLYLRISYTGGSLVGIRYDCILDLDQKSYIGTTFATMLKSKIQEKLTTEYSGNIVCTFNSTTNKLSLTLHVDILWQFLTDRELLDPQNLTAGNFDWTGASYDKNNLKSANAVISNTQSTSTANDSNLHVFNKHLNLQPIRNIYLHSPNLGNFQTLGAKGDQTIIKKIPVSSNQGDMIFSDYTGSGFDMLDCSKQTLRQIEFRLTNVDGIEIPFHDNHVSFSIVFN